MSYLSLGPVDQIPRGEGRTFVVGGQQIAIFRLRDGSLRALDAVCPHRGGPLADGLADSHVVICPLHGYTYDLTTGCEVAGGGAAVTAYSAYADEAGNIRLQSLAAAG